MAEAILQKHANVKLEIELCLHQGIQGWWPSHWATCIQYTVNSVLYLSCILHIADTTARQGRHSPGIMTNYHDQVMAALSPRPVYVSQYPVIDAYNWQITGRIRAARVWPARPQAAAPSSASPAGCHRAGAVNIPGLGCAGPARRRALAARPKISK